MTVLLAVIVAWLACAVFASGASFAQFQAEDERHEREFPNIFKNWAAKNQRQNLAFSIGWSLLFGPIAAILVVFLTGFLEHGWRLR